MSTDLNMEYQEVKFGEIAKHISKRVEPSETTLEIYVGLEHLDPDSLKITRHGVPSDVAGQKLLVKKGQIIFGKRRAYQRKVAVADWDCICSAHAMVLEAVPGKILPEYLPFFMQSNQFMERAVDVSEGSLSPTIKWKVLENQLFSIPSIDDQKKVIKSLNEIMKIQAYVGDQIVLANKLYKLKANTIFESLDDEYLVELKTIGSTYSGLQGKTSPDFGVGDAKYITYLNIFNNKIIDVSLLEKVQVDTDEHQNEVKKGDIFFTVSSEVPEEVGMSSVLIDDVDNTYLNSFCVGFRPKENKVHSGYMSHYLRSLYFRKNIRKLAQGSTRFNISRTELLKEKIKVPSLKQQVAVSKSLDQFFELEKLLQLKSDVLKKIYFSLLN